MLTKTKANGRSLQTMSFPAVTDCSRRRPLSPQEEGDPAGPNCRAGSPALVSKRVHPESRLSAALRAERGEDRPLPSLGTAMGCQPYGAGGQRKEATTWASSVTVSASTVDMST